MKKKAKTAGRIFSDVKKAPFKPMPHLPKNPMSPMMKGKKKAY